MRIAIYHNQPSGGARRALAGFGRELARRHSVDVFTLSTSDQDLLSDADWAASVTSLPFQPRGFVRMGLFLNDLARERTLNDLDLVNQEAAARIDAGGYDVALVDACRLTYAPSILHFLRTPTVHYCHHGPWRIDGVETRTARSGYEEARRLVHLLFEKRFEGRIRRADVAAVRAAGKVVVNSAYTGRRVREEYGVEPTVCPPGVAVPPTRVEPVDRGHILSVGALEPHKGHDILIQAIAGLPRPNRPPLHVVANDGSDPYRRRLETLATEGGVDLRIAFRITDEELEAEYGGAVLFAYGARFEPLGLAPLEAMARALAVVAVGEGGVRETVIDGRTGILVPASGLGLRAAITSLIADPERRRQMGEEGRREIERHWAWAQRAAVLEDVLVGASLRTAVLGASRA